MKRKLSWREKLADSKDLPKVLNITGKMSTRWGSGTVVIPAPMEVEEIMKKVPKGKLITVNEIRGTLARKHGASIGCPITTGIFALVAARAAEEDWAEGKRRVESEGWSGFTSRPGTRSGTPSSPAKSCKWT